MSFPLFSAIFFIWLSTEARGIYGRGNRFEGDAIMQNEPEGSSINISSVEMLGIGGFGLFFAWVFICFYWLFCEFPPDAPTVMRDLAQLFVFAAVPVGYLILNARGRNPEFNLFSTSMKVSCTIMAAVQPVIALCMYLGVVMPFAVVCVANLLAGFAAASFRLAWLDICSRLGISHFSRYTGMSMFVGGLLFVLVAFTPTVMQPVFALVFLFGSCGLMSYTSRHAPGNDERAPLESVADTWRFTKEIEPSFFMFGVVFAMTLVFLFNSGPEKVLLGLITSLVGSLVVMILSIADRQPSITVYQRGLVVVTVAACVALPFFERTGQVVLSCVVVAAWAMFVAINSAYIVRKCVLAREAPLFRQAPVRLAVPALGFAVGWALATAFTLAFGPHAAQFTYLRLAVAIVLVLVVMVFLPQPAHHPADGLSPTGEKVTTTVVTVDVSETELFERRCAAVAKLYQLSPRETEILGFLAKGRNAAYIQEELVISPHTVKSHIYNIYRKLDIHSQQKLMDFVEDFPLD